MPGFGLEAPTMGNKVLGSGPTAVPGSSRTGSRVSQAFVKEEIAFATAEKQEAKTERTRTAARLMWIQVQASTREVQPTQEETPCTALNRQRDSKLHFIETNA